MKTNNMYLQTKLVLMVVVLCAGLLTGCQTPDLKLFSNTSATLSTSVKQGGELAITPLAGRAVWGKDANGGDKLFQPGEDGHPYRQLVDEWEVRRKAMDAILVYSASLEAINQASIHRQQNAHALVGSVQQLAEAVPGYGAAFNEAGKLVVKGLEMTVEVIAWHDMRRAVKSADPAIQLVARGLTNDLAKLKTQFKAPLRTTKTKLTDEWRELTGLEEALRNQRKNQRDTVATAVSDSSMGAELARLDGLYATVATELDQKRNAVDKLKSDITEGEKFFDTAIQTVNAWADAHAELVKAFDNNRQPNLALLAARAQEVKDLVDQLKKK